MTVDTGFSFHITPLDAVHRPLTCNFSIALSGETIWPVLGDDGISVEIQIDDLFAYLVEFWRPLVLRQTYPYGLTPNRPARLVRDMETRWTHSTQEVVDEEAEALGAFEDAHDLSRAFGGQFDLPHFWMVRQGDRMVCDNGQRLWEVSFDEALAELTRCGDSIAEHLTKTAPEKWDRVTKAWERRAEIDQIELVAWSASLDHDVAEALVGSGAISAPGTLDEAANDNDPLLIAARMAGELPTDQIVAIINIAKSFTAVRSDELDRVSQHCCALLAGKERTPAHTQGEMVAREIRTLFGISPSERLDIFSFFKERRVTVQSARVEPNTFDGLAIAGGHYGPGAFINLASKRHAKYDGYALSDNPAARVTLAHELCHLILDRDHPLSAVEILRSRMPASVEARARAFAGELLLPTQVAADFWDRAGSPIDQERVGEVLQELAERFGVSFSVAAWKLEHGSGEQRYRLRPVLDALAPHR